MVLPSPIWCEDEGTTTNLEGRVIKINQADGAARRGAPRLGDRRRAGATARARPVLPLSRRPRDLRRAARRLARAASPTTTGSPGRRSTRRTASSGPAPTRTTRARRACSPSASATPTGGRACSPSPTGHRRRSRGGDFPIPSDDRPGRLPLSQREPDAPARLPRTRRRPSRGWRSIHARPDDWASPARTIVRVRTPRGAMELQALVAPTIRPDTLFIPFHYGHRQAVNQLTNPRRAIRR